MSQYMHGKKYFSSTKPLLSESFGLSYTLQKKRTDYQTEQNCVLQSHDFFRSVYVKPMNYENKGFVRLIYVYIYTYLNVCVFLLFICNK